MCSIHVANHMEFNFPEPHNLKFLRNRANMSRMNKVRLADFLVNQTDSVDVRSLKALHDSNRRKTKVQKQISKAFEANKALSDVKIYGENNN